MAQGAPAFFSYSRQDSEFAIRLAEDLKAAGANVWLDQLDIDPGERWDSAVENALTNCPRLLVILALIIAAATVSLFALGFTLQKPPDETALAQARRLGLAGLAVVFSWTLTHSTFALHYAHHFYGDGPRPGNADDRGGLAFPGSEPPNFFDFLYFSLVVGMTCQVSDVQVTSRPMRRLTLLHGVLAFFFNTVILALAVNLLASSL